MQVSSTFSVLKSHEKKQKPRAGSITTTPELTQCQGSARAAVVSSSTQPGPGSCRPRYLSMKGPDRFTLFCDATELWCARPPSFRDLASDPAGWGGTAEEAVFNLLQQPEFHEGVRVGRWGMPTVVDFVEVPEPDGTKGLPIDYEPTSSKRAAAIRRQSFRDR